MAEAHARHEATDEELRAAWRLCRTHSWPDTFEETMLDPLRERLVRTTAAGLTRKRHAREATGTVDEPACSVHGTACHEVRASRRCANCALRPPPPRTFRAPDPGFVDRKRLAAGDRDDD
jgi:hypothetical protein